MLTELTKCGFVIAIIFTIVLVPDICRAQQEAASKTPAWTAPSYKARVANPVSANAASVSRGKEIYQQQCAVCHGAGGAGDGAAAVALQPPPANLSDSSIQGQSDGSFFWKISSGRTPMPAFETIISEEDRWNVVNFLRSLASDSDRTAERSILADQKRKRSTDTQNKEEAIR